jgi:2-dehydro-3-deoxyglucarate aldolase
VGCWITIPHSNVAELLCRAGFDWLTVDLEHTCISLESTSELIRVIDLMGISPFVRVGNHDANVIKRVMDAGAHGIIASTINTPEQARQIVSAVKYPPPGTRGVGLARAQGYLYEFDEHYRWLNEESIVIVQIEHIEAVQNLEAILSVPGVDGFLIGPYDLSASLHIPGQFQHPKMKESLEEVDRIRKKKSDVVAGCYVIPTNPDEVRKKFEEGYKFVAYTLDFLLLFNKAREGLEAIRK